MKVYYKSTHLSVTEEDKKVTIRRRGLLNSLIGAGSFALSAVLIVLAFTLENEVYGELLLWVAAIFLFFVPVNLLIAFIRIFGKKIVFDETFGTVSVGKRIYPFRDVKELGVQKREIMEVESYSISALLDGKKTYIVEGQTEANAETLQLIAERLQKMFAAPVETKDQENVALENAAMTGKFVGMFLLGFGLVWSIPGYFFMPDLILVIGDDSGPLLWPLGIWIAVPGIAQLLRVPLLETIPEWPQWGQLTAGAAYFLSYIIICYEYVQNVTP